MAAPSPFKLRPETVSAHALFRDAGSRSSGRTLDDTHAEVFDFQIVLDAVFRTLTAVAALLDAAERCNLGRDQAFVDTDDAVLERFGNAPDPSDIAP